MVSNSLDLVSWLGSEVWLQRVFVLRAGRVWDERDKAAAGLEGKWNRTVYCDCSYGFCQLQLPIRQWPYWKLLGIWCQQIHKLSWKKWKKYISISHGSQGPTAVVCWWYPQWLVSNTEAQHWAVMQGRKTLQKLFLQQFQSQGHKRERVRALAFLPPSELQTLHSCEHLPRLGILPVIPKLTANLPDGHSAWCEIVSKVWRSKPFRVYCSLSYPWERLCCTPFSQVHCFRTGLSSRLFDCWDQLVTLSNWCICSSPVDSRKGCYHVTWGFVKFKAKIPVWNSSGEEKSVIEKYEASLGLKNQVG